MNIFTIFILTNFNKIFSKTHQIASFLKNAPEPPINHVASPRAAWREDIPTFPKIF